MVAHRSPSSIEKPIGKASKSNGSQLLVKADSWGSKAQCQSVSLLYLPKHTGHTIFKMTKLDSHSVSTIFKQESGMVNAWHSLDI